MYWESSKDAKFAIQEILEFLEGKATVLSFAYLESLPEDAENGWEDAI